MRPPRPVLERFLPKYTIEESGCWRWTASLNTAGYGQLSVGTGETKRPHLAHRISYFLFVGAIPDDLELDHLCRNRWCVNPKHLEPVTHQENMQRAMPYSNVGWRRNLTHCRAGHKFTEENTYRRGTHRHCRACHRERERKRRHGTVTNGP